LFRASPGVAPVGGEMVRVAVPIVPVTLYASVTCTVRLPPPPPERVSHSGIEMLPTATENGCCSTGDSVHVAEPPPPAIDWLDSPAGAGTRERINPGVSRRYSGFNPGAGMRDGDTTAGGAAGLASEPKGFSTLATLAMVAPGDRPVARTTSNATLTVPPAGTPRLPTSRNPVPFAPVPPPVEAL